MSTPGPKNVLGVFLRLIFPIFRDYLIAMIEFLMIEFENESIYKHFCGSFPQGLPIA